MPQMERTSDLRDGYKFSVASTDDGFEVTIRNTAVNKKGRAYWKYLQDGTDTMVPRKQFVGTTSQLFLNKEWMRRIKRVYVEAIHDCISKGYIE